MTVDDLITHLSSLPAEVRSLPVYLADWNEEYATPMLLEKNQMGPWTEPQRFGDEPPLGRVFILGLEAERLADGRD